MLQFFFKQPSQVHVQNLIKQAYIYFDKLKRGELLFSPTKDGFVKAFQPMSNETYPLFNKYPEFIVDYKTKMRLKIQEEEEEYMRKLFDFRAAFI